MGEGQEGTTEKKTTFTYIEDRCTDWHLFSDGSAHVVGALWEERRVVDAGEEHRNRPFSCERAVRELNTVHVNIHSFECGVNTARHA